MAKNRTIIFGIIFISVISAGIYAQSTNYEPLLVGTWVQVGRGETWVFNADGTGSQHGGRQMKYGAIDGKLVIIWFFDDGSYQSTVSDYVISNDGKTLILMHNFNGYFFGYLLQKES